MGENGADDKPTGLQIGGPDSWFSLGLTRFRWADGVTCWNAHINLGALGWGRNWTRYPKGWRA